MKRLIKLAILLTCLTLLRRHDGKTGKEFKASAKRGTVNAD